METMTRLETFCNLDYKSDPFKAAKKFETGDISRVRRILTMAIESHAMVSIVGERGIGKSDAIEAALKKFKVRLIPVIREDQENLRAPEIKAAMISALSTESVKRGGVVSSAQLRRIVGEATIDPKQQVVVVIEEAQRLHPNTLRSLKTLREIEWLGQKELFTIILVAQSDPMNRAGVSEVALRSDCIRMKGLSADEAAEYVRATIGKHFEDSAIDALAELPQARNYLELQALCVTVLNHALADGRELVKVADVTAAAGEQTAEPLQPRTARKQQAAPVSGKAALAGVLARRQGDLPEQKGAINA